MALRATTRARYALLRSAWLRRLHASHPTRWPGDRGDKVNKPNYANHTANYHRACSPPAPSRSHHTSNPCSKRSAWCFCWSLRYVNLRIQPGKS